MLGLASRALGDAILSCCEHLHRQRPLRLSKMPSCKSLMQPVTDSCVGGGP